MNSSEPHCKSPVLALLQRHSRQSLALKRNTSKDMSRSAHPSSRRLSLDKAQSRKALGSQKALNTHQTLQGNGVADGHQKPTGTAMNPLADVETGQMHHGSPVDGTQDVKRSNNSGMTVLLSSFLACAAISILLFGLKAQLTLQCHHSHNSKARQRAITAYWDELLSRSCCPGEHWAEARVCFDQT